MAAVRTLDEAGKEARVTATQISGDDALDERSRDWLRAWNDRFAPAGWFAARVRIRLVENFERQTTHNNSQLVAFDISNNKLRRLGSIVAVDIMAGPSGVVVSKYAPAPFAKLNSWGVTVQDRSLCPRWWTIATLPECTQSVLPDSPQYRVLEWISPHGTTPENPLAPDARSKQRHL